MPRQYSLGASRAAAKGSFSKTGISLVKSHEDHAKCGFPCLSASQSESNHFETQHIPYKNVLFCGKSSAGELELTYAVISEKKVSIYTDVVEFGSYGENSAQEVDQHVLALSYGASTIKPRILILLNNHGGQGNARKLYQAHILPVLRAAHVDLTYMETQYSAHATDLAREMDLLQYDIIACCSGDGVPHEVINGFYQRPDRAEAFSKIAITQLPCGSGNALSLSTHGTNSPGIATLKMLKSRRARMDAMAVNQAESTKLSFLSQAYGTIADSDIGTEHLRWMGSLRFEVGVAQRLILKTTYPCDVYVKYALKDKAQIEDHFAFHTDKSRRAENPENNDLESVDDANLQLKYPDISSPPPSDWEHLPQEVSQNLNIFYVGKMPYVSSDTQFFPAALPDDGCMDMVITSARTPFLKMVGMLFSIDKGAHVNSPEVLHSKIAAYRLVPRVSAENHYISVDGENFPFEPIQVEVLTKVLTVLLDDGAFVDTSLTTK